MNNNYRGLSFSDGLMLMLIGFKLAGIIDWTWTQVILLPLAVIFGISFLVALLTELNKTLSGDDR